MRLPLFRRLVPILLASVPLLAGAAQPDADGLLRQSAKGLATYAQRPGEALAGYHLLHLAPVVVRFKKTWADEHRNVKPEEAGKLQADLTQLAQDAFRHVMSQGGRFEIVEAAAPGVLELRIVLDDFDLYAPEVSDSSTRRDYVFTAGEATLVAELRDAQAGTILARARDHREMRRYYQLQIANSITNSAEARDLVEDWARALRRQIDSAKPGKKGS
jgi:hypothetical protein